MSAETFVHAPPGQRLLGKLATSFAERLPLGLREMRALLASDGCPVECRELADVLRYYRASGASAPFRIVRFGGMEIAVDPEQSRLAGQVGAAAVRMVQHWGIVSVEALADRVGVVSTALIPRMFVEKVVGALPATHWLNGPAPRRQWFSFIGRSSGLADALDKILTLGRRVSVPEVRAALARTCTAVTDAPPAVFERYLIDVAGCDITDGHVARYPSPPEDILSKAERTLVQILRAAAGRLSPSTLRRRASENDLSDATLTRLLRFSPLVTRSEDDEICLVGHDDAAPGEARRSSSAPVPRRPFRPVKLAS